MQYHRVASAVDDTPHPLRPHAQPQPLAPSSSSSGGGGGAAPQQDIVDVFVLAEYRMQDVGGLAGHPATFRISRGHALFRLQVGATAVHAACMGGLGFASCQTRCRLARHNISTSPYVTRGELPTIHRDGVGAQVALAGAAGGAKVVRGWVRRQLTHEEREQRIKVRHRRR